MQRRWKISACWIVFVSVCFAIDVFSSIHPWGKALPTLFTFVFAVVVSYIFGHLNASWEQNQNTDLDPVEKELLEWLKSSPPNRSIMRTRTRFHFKDSREN